MEVRAFAEQVLVGPTLADKLLAPAELTDDAPSFRGPLPEAPGRLDTLAMRRGKGPRTPMRVPDDARERGALLHAFANHELLAVELLARALLAYPEAPAAFRRGLVQTLREEQQHLSLYLERMQALGVALGDEPLSGFFWRAMAGLDTPQAFVAHLSLTFEQANLDFATHYQREFAAMGDHATAAVLQTVLDDEIGHVALGLRWFERWRDRDVSLFEAHRDALRAPLQVVRAKAASFDVGARRLAGLPDGYIEQLRTCGGSRGASARVWWFNGAAEHEVEQGMRYTPSASTLAAVRDLETVPMFLAKEADVVLVRQTPSPRFLERLAAAGFVLPRFEEAALERSPWPAPRRIGAIAELRPWAPSPRADAFGATARARVSGDGAQWLPSMRALYDKRTAVRLSAALPEDPCWTDHARAARVATSWGAVLEARGAFASLGHATRLKPTFGAAGRGHCVLRGETDERLGQQLLARCGAVIVEPELEVVAQFSLRFQVDARGVVLVGIGRCGSDVRGRFDHAVIGAPDLGLSPEVRRWLRGEGRDPERLERMAKAVGETIRGEVTAAGLHGALGVDALLVRVDGALRLRPLVDLNPRHTMGHLAHALRNHVSSRAYAAIRVTTRADLGHGDFTRWAEQLPSAAFETRDGRRRLVAGAVPLTDPEVAQQLVLILAAGGSVDEALDIARGGR